MDLIKMVPLGKEMVQNCNKCGRNADWNGMSCDGEEVGFQPVNMVPRFLTIRLPDNSKYPYLFKLLVLPAQPLVKQLNSNSQFQLCPFRNLSLSLCSHACNDPCRGQLHLRISKFPYN
jgi:hypothetical protein